jgi:uncharacterized protein
MARVHLPFTHDRILAILRAVHRQYQLSWTGLHGVRHWARVMENGLRVASETGADREVVALFALFHDARRVNDHIDRGHGQRGADLAVSMQGRLFDLDGHRLDLLIDACSCHTRGLLEADPTVQTCWDADRLDLLRAGINPSPHKLCTEAARDPETIAWANDRSINDYVPSFARDGWLDLGHDHQL